MEDAVAPFKLAFLGAQQETVDLAWEWLLPETEASSYPRQSSFVEHDEVVMQNPFFNTHLNRKPALLSSSLPPGAVVAGNEVDRAANAGSAIIPFSPAFPDAFTADARTPRSRQQSFSYHRGVGGHPQQHAAPPADTSASSQNVSQQWLSSSHMKNGAENDMLSEVWERNVLQPRRTSREVPPQVVTAVGQHVQETAFYQQQNAFSAAAVAVVKQEQQQQEQQQFQFPNTLWQQPRRTSISRPSSLYSFDPDYDSDCEADSSFHSASLFSTPSQSSVSTPRHSGQFFRSPSTSSISSSRVGQATKTGEAVSIDNEDPIVDDVFCTLLTSKLHADSFSEPPAVATEAATTHQDDFQDEEDEEAEEDEEEEDYDDESGPSSFYDDTLLHAGQPPPTQYSNEGLLLWQHHKHFEQHLQLQQFQQDAVQRGHNHGVLPDEHTAPAYGRVGRSFSIAGPIIHYDTITGEHKQQLPDGAMFPHQLHVANPGTTFGISPAFGSGSSYDAASNDSTVTMANMNSEAIGQQFQKKRRVGRPKGYKVTPKTAKVKLEPGVSAVAPNSSPPISGDGSDSGYDGGRQHDVVSPSKARTLSRPSSKSAASKAIAAAGGRRRSMTSVGGLGGVDSELDSEDDESDDQYDEDKGSHLWSKKSAASSTRRGVDATEYMVQTHEVVQWLRRNYRLQANAYVTRKDVYDQFAVEHMDDPISASGFGKLVRQAFPKLKCRRLGRRGDSRYCYFGLAPLAVTGISVNIYSTKRSERGSEME